MTAAIPRLWRRESIPASDGSVYHVGLVMASGRVRAVMACNDPEQLRECLDTHDLQSTVRRAICVRLRQLERGGVS